MRTKMAQTATETPAFRMPTTGDMTPAELGARGWADPAGELPYSYLPRSTDHDLDATRELPAFRG